MFDPEFGEMVEVGEVSRLTGLSVHQLRSWRKPEYAHLAKFEVYRSPLSSKVWYRLADVEVWLAEQGIVSGLSGLSRVAELPNAVRAEVVAVSVSDEKRRWLLELGDITTETMWLRWSNRLSEMLGADFPKRLRVEQARLFALWRGLPVEAVDVFVPVGRKHEVPDQFFVGNVLAFRRLLADVRGWSVNDAELLALPVGDVPPLREVK